MNERREQSKEARLLVERAGFGDVLQLTFIVNEGEQPTAAILMRPSILKAMEDDDILECLRVAGRAGALLEEYGWEVMY